MFFEDCCAYDPVGGTNCWYYFWCYTKVDMTGCRRVADLVMTFYDYNLNK